MLKKGNKASIASMIEKNIPNDAIRDRVKAFGKVELYTGKGLRILIALQQIEGKGTIKTSSTTTLTKSELRRVYPGVLPFK